MRSLPAPMAVNEPLRWSRVRPRLLVDVTRVFLFVESGAMVRGQGDSTACKHQHDA